MTGRLMAGGRTHVRFDYDGALMLAKELWALNTTLQETATKRRAAADTALNKWEGKFGEDFATAAESEVTEIHKKALAARTDAKLWAQEWANAINKENFERWNAKIEEVRSQRSFFEANVGDLFLGDDSAEQVKDLPDEVKAPKASKFVATGVLVEF